MATGRLCEGDLDETGDILTVLVQWSLRTARFNIQQIYVLPTQCIYVFFVDLRTNSDYFPIQHNWLVFITEI